MRIDRSLWEKYCKGEASPEELKAIETWLLSNPDHDNEFRKWNTADNDTGSTMPEAMAERVRERLLQLTQKGRLRHISSRWMAAASIVLVIFSGISFWVLRKHEATPAASASLVWDSVVNRGVSARRIQLADGTNIWLNRNTTLYINKNFTKERLVQLDGEAYFDVSRDEIHPFRVLTGGIRTTVLGTAFNIDYNPGQAAVYISLLNGRVSVGRMGMDITLHPGEMAVAGEKGDIPVSRIGVPDASGWIRGDLVFNQIPLAEALHKLEQFYGLDISVDPELLKDKVVTAAYHKGESWQKVLNHLLFIYHMTYQGSGANQVQVSLVRP